MREPAVVNTVVTRLRSLVGSDRIERTFTVVRRFASWLVWLWRTIIEISLRCDSDHVFMLAAGIAFNIITALVPTILVILYVLGYILESDAIIAQLNELATTYIIAEGYRSDIMITLKAQIDSLVANRGIAGLIGIIGLLWSASALASAIRVSVNKVLRCRETRNYFIYKLYDIVGIMLIGLLVFVSIVTGPLLELVLATSDRVAIFLDFNLAGFEWIISEVLNGVITLLLFFVIFRFVPYQRQQRIIIWVGTLASTALWEIARYTFRFYLTEFGTLSRVYGVYAFFAAAALWIYFSALVFLLGAEIAYHVKQSRWFARRAFDSLSHGGWEH